MVLGFFGFLSSWVLDSWVPFLRGVRSVSARRLGCVVYFRVKLQIDLELNWG